MVKAISEGNIRMMDGHLIKVKESVNGYHRSKMGDKSSSHRNLNPSSLFLKKDAYAVGFVEQGKLYKEALLGANKLDVNASMSDDIFVDVVLLENRGKTARKDVTEDSNAKSVVFDLNIPHCDMD
ncbi:hypothetical protein REPUB_Repub11eG0068000 [Reevesia pubescens]